VRPSSGDTHLFLNLPAFRDPRLVDRLQKHWRTNVRNFALNLARDVNRAR